MASLSSSFDLSPEGNLSRYLLEHNYALHERSVGNLTWQLNLLVYHLKQHLLQHG